MLSDTEIALNTIQRAIHEALEWSEGKRQRFYRGIVITDLRLALLASRQLKEELCSGGESTSPSSSSEPPDS